MNITYETKANGSIEGKATVYNSFQLGALKQKLEKEGFNDFGPYQYQTDFNGFLTKKVTIYRACHYSKRTTVYIYNCI